MFILTWWKEILGASLIIVIAGLFYFISIQKNTILEKEAKIQELSGVIKTLQGVNVENNNTILNLEKDIKDLRNILSGNDEISSETIHSLKNIIGELKKKAPQTVTVYDDCKVTEVTPDKNSTKENPNDFIKLNIENIGKF